MVDWHSISIPTSFRNVLSFLCCRIQKAKNHIAHLPCSSGCEYELDSCPQRLSTEIWKCRCRGPLFLRLWLLLLSRRVVTKMRLCSRNISGAALASGGRCEYHSNIGSQLSIPASLVLKVGQLGVACMSLGWSKRRQYSL